RYGRRGPAALEVVGPVWARPGAVRQVDARGPVGPERDRTLCPNLPGRRRGRLHQEAAGDRSGPYPRGGRIPRIRAAHPSAQVQAMPPPPIRISPSAQPLAAIDADWLVVGVSSDGPPDPAVAELDRQLGGQIARLREAGDVTGKHPELVSLLSVRGISARRMLLVGLGPVARYSRSVFDAARAAALPSITRRNFSRVAVAIPPLPAPADSAAAVLGLSVGAVQGCYGPGLRKSEPARHAPDEIALVGDPAPAESLVNRVRVEGNAVALARELVNLPPCDLYPETFAARAL